MKIIMLLMFVSISFLPTSAQRRVAGIGLKIDRISGPNYSISGFPERMRNIPRHRNDDWLAYYKYANNTLADKTLSYETIADYYCNVYISVFDVIRGGASVIIPSPKRESTRYSQNQHGTSSRGYGTSLRYYEMFSSEIGLGLYAAIASPTITMYSNRDISFGLRPVIIDAVYQILPFTMSMQTGWDRYGFDEKFKNVEIGEIRKPYISCGAEFSLGIYGISDYIDEDVKIGIYAGYARAFVQSSGEMIYTGENEKDGIMLSIGVQANL